MTLNKTLGATALLALLSTQLYAQQQPVRLTATAWYRYDQGTNALVPADSSTVSYKQNNSNVGGIDDFKKDKLLYDTVTFGDYGTRTAPTPYNEKSRYIRSYDANGRLSLIETMVYDATTSLWDKTAESIYTYSNAGDSVLELHKQLNNSTGQMDTSHWKLDVYDANKNLVEERQYLSFYNNTTIIKTNTYDNKNQLTETIQTFIDSLTKTLDTTNRIFYHYTNAGDQDTITNQNFDTAAHQFVNNIRRYYTYDNNHNPTLLISQFYKSAGWVHGSMVEYQYDNQNRISQTITSQYRTNSWAQELKNNYTYTGANDYTIKLYETDNRGNFSQTALQTFIYNSHNYLQHFMHAYDYQNSGIITRDSTEYYYPIKGGGTTGINSASAISGDFTMYPNPAKTTLHLNVALSDDQPYSITVYDMTGKMLQSQQAPAGKQQHTIQVGNLTAGQYLIEVRTQHNKMVKPFVITP